MANRGERADTFELRWHPSRLALAITSCAVLTTAAAMITGRAELLAFAAPLLGALAGAWRRGIRAGRLRIRPTFSATRCFEGESVRFALDMTPDGPCDELRYAIPPTPAIAASSAGPAWSVRPLRWGQRSLPIHITGHTNGGLLAASLALNIAELRVYPRPEQLSVTPYPADLPERAGGHVGRARGDGAEFAGIRPYLPGDALRRVNWAASARRGQLHVTERLAEQAAEVIAIIDAYSDVTQAGGSSLDLAVRGATDLARAALRQGDRVGVVALGGILRWLGTDIGDRQFYRIVETVLEVRLDEAVLAPDLDRIPRSALPPRAAAVVFSPLLDPRTSGALRDLRQRGCAVVVVDVLRADPPVEKKNRWDELALRMWRIERRGIRLELA
ncbi:MAG: DUF58 domain-containing protein, partial [Sciscionella sp.]